MAGRARDVRLGRADGGCPARPDSRARVLRLHVAAGPAARSVAARPRAGGDAGVVTAPGRPCRRLRRRGPAGGSRRVPGRALGRAGVPAARGAGAGSGAGSRRRAVRRAGPAHGLGGDVEGGAQPGGSGTLDGHDTILPLARGPPPGARRDGCRGSAAGPRVVRAQGRRRAHGPVRGPGGRGAAFLPAGRRAGRLRRVRLRAAARSGRRRHAVHGAARAAGAGWGHLRPAGFGAPRQFLDRGRAAPRGHRRGGAWRLAGGRCGGHGRGGRAVRGPRAAWRGLRAG